MLQEWVKPQITMKQLAKEYGCSPAYVSMVLSGKKRPSLRFKLFCSKKFGLPAIVLFPEERGGTHG